jgi:Kef-type K+ transport system membrane component KefB
LVVACLGKFGGTFAAASYAGLPWREGATLGTLMNTRGLMELIVLNVGLEQGVISPTLFSMLVVMAVVTTLATAPILDLLSNGAARPLRNAEAG